MGNKNGSPSSGTSSPSPCAGGCGYMRNTSASYFASKAAEHHAYCCEACHKSGGSVHGGFCQRKGRRQAASSSASSSRTMFHGTSATAAKSIASEGFKPSADGMLGAGVYVSQDINKARKHGPVVLETKVKTGKVKAIDRQGHAMQKTWAREGYDSAWVPPNTMNPSGMEESCVRDAKNVSEPVRIHTTMYWDPDWEKLY